MCIDQSCDIDTRDPLRKNIVIAGGASLVPFFDSFLTQAIEKSANSFTDQQLVLKSLSPDRKFHCWQGMAIIAQLGLDVNRMITKEDYDEVGSSGLTYHV